MEIVFHPVLFQEIPNEVRLTLVVPAYTNMLRGFFGRRFNAIIYDFGNNFILPMLSRVKKKIFA